MKVPEEKAFVHKGKKIHSLNDLISEIKSMSNSEFSHYVGPMHNYFADWIMHVMKNKELAKAVKKSKSKKNTLKLLNKEIKEKEKLNKIDLTETLHRIQRDESEIKHLLWKHYNRDLAK